MMPARQQERKQRKPSVAEMITHTNSIDLPNDLAYLISYINSNNILLWALLSGQLTNISCSNLYAKSREIGWEHVLTDVRNSFKLDEKLKPKRFMLNRLIEECCTNVDEFNKKVENLISEMKIQMSNSIVLGQKNGYNLYTEVKAWRQLQCERRLFYRQYTQRCSLPILQRLMTDHFIYLANSLRCNPNYFSLTGVRDALKELFDYCLIMVVQPSGTDCIAVTKYEKIGKDFSAKIKTRIICLLDPNRIQEYLELFTINLTLYLKDREVDPEGEVQLPLSWKTRTIICDEIEARTFLYIELNENDWVRLTKKNSSRKLLYNNRLCQLEFQTKFKIIGTNFEESVTIESQLFGLCSHPKYSPKYLAKVFLEAIKGIYKDIHLDTHINTLEGYIYDFYKRMTGVEAKRQTRQFIHDELVKVYASYCSSGNSPTGPVLFFNLDLYEDILDKFFTQIKFLASHPFLSMMYYDSLFLGICSDTVDEQVNNNRHLLMRFALFKEQQTPDNPNLIFTIYNGKPSKSRVTHGYLTTDMCVCICEAAENEGNQLQIFNNNETVPFSNFRWYYDADLSRDNLIQTNDRTKYFPLKFLLQNTIRNNPVQFQTPNGDQMRTYTFDLCGQITSNVDLTTDAIAFLQEQFTRWCSLRNAHGSLSQYTIDNMELADGDFSEFL